MMRKTATAVCGAAVLAMGMTGCASTFEGSGSKDAASAEQLAMRLDDPWAQEASSDARAKAEGTLADGVYTGEGKGMEGPITVTLLVQDNRISCLETTQEGESQSRGGYEAIRDGKFADHDRGCSRGRHRRGERRHHHHGGRQAGGGGRALAGGGRSCGARTRGEAR